MALVCLLGMLIACAALVFAAMPAPASYGAPPRPVWADNRTQERQRHSAGRQGDAGTAAVLCKALTLRQGFTPLEVRSAATVSGPPATPAQEAVLRSDTWGPGLITVTGDLLISPGVIVTIAPGTTIQMATTDGANLGVDPNRIEVIVRGTLYVDGPVILTSLDSSPVCGNWYGLRFLPGSDGLIHDALIEKAVHAVEINSTKRITVTDSTLRYNCHEPPSGDAWGAGMTILAGTHTVMNTQIYGNRLLTTGPQARAIGAGVWLAGGSTRFEDSLVYENVARSAADDALGGGMALWGSGQPVLHHCEIHHNAATAAKRALGGGVHIDNADAVIHADTFVHDNAATAEGGPAYGGGIAISALERVPALSIVDSRVTANLCSAHSTAGCFGGGIGFASPLGQPGSSLALISWPAESQLRHADRSPLRGDDTQLGLTALPPPGATGGQTEAILSHNLIAGNMNLGQSAYGGGIGMEAGAWADRFDANLIRDNLVQATAGQACGAGICLALANGVHLTNNLLVNNQAIGFEGGSAAGGGIYADGANSYLVNNTIVNNSARDGGGVYLGNGALYNNIVVSNQASHDAGGVYRLGGNAGFNDVWSNTPNGYAAGGLPRPSTDITSNPRFVGVGELAHSYHLRRISPCVDAGTAVGAGIPSHDFDQHPRPQGTAWDMGFDEVLGFEIEKGASATEITSGGLLSYTIVLTNWSTTSPVDDLWIRDLLPPHLTWRGGPACSRPTCGRGDGSVWWQGKVPASASLTLIYTGMVEPGAPITNAAYYSVGAGPAPIQGWSNVVTTTIHSPVLTLSKRTAGVGKLVAGAPFTYTVLVANASPLAAASGVVITEALPAGTAWVSGGDHKNGIVTLSVPNVPAQGQAQTSWLVSTCRTIVNNQWYRVVTSTQLVDSPWGPPLATKLRAPKLVPNFGQSSGDVIAGGTVTFTDGSAFEGTPIAAWGWDFGDGTRGSGTPVTHAYNVVANYTVTLTITDGCGYTQSLHMPDAVTVRPPPGCAEVSEVDLKQITNGTTYTASPVQFSADISPDDAQKRYSFRLIVDGTLGFPLTSGKDPLTFNQIFGLPGTHHIGIAVWNCRMAEAEAATDTVEVRVVFRPSLHLPIVVKDYRDPTGAGTPALPADK